MSEVVKLGILPRIIWRFCRIGQYDQVVRSDFLLHCNIAYALWTCVFFVFGVSGYCQRVL